MFGGLHHSNIITVVPLYLPKKRRAVITCSRHVTCCAFQYSNKDNFRHINSNRILILLVTNVTNTTIKLADLFSW